MYFYHTTFLFADIIKIKTMKCYRFIENRNLPENVLLWNFIIRIYYIFIIQLIIF